MINPGLPGLRIHNHAATKVKSRESDPPQEQGLTQVNLVTRVWSKLKNGVMW